MKRIIAAICSILLLMGCAFAAELKAPAGIYADPQTHLIVDAGQNAVFSVNQNGELELFAGKINPVDIYGNSAGGYLNGAALEAQFDTPWDIVPFLSGYIVSDSGNNCLRYISGGKVSTFAGSRVAGLKNGTGSAAAFNCPRGLASDGSTLYVADTLNNCIRAVDKNGIVSTYAGSTTEGYADGERAKALFNAPSGLCWYDGALYVADTGNHCIRKIENGVVSTVAGADSPIYEESGERAGGYADGWASAALFESPYDVAVDSLGIFIADTGNSAVRRINSEGWVCSIESTPAFAKPGGVELVGNELCVTDKFTGKVFFIEITNVCEHFTDVPSESWYQSYVDFCVQNGLFKGVNESSFAPNAPMQRGMVAMVLGRTAQLSERSLLLYGERDFNDVPKNAYYAASLAWAADNGLIGGVSEAEFAPTKNTSRQELIVMLYRLAAYRGLDMNSAASLDSFADSDEVADWAVYAMRWAVSKNLVRGDELGRLSPQADVTRAQAAKLFSEFAKLA